MSTTSLVPLRIDQHGRCACSPASCWARRCGLLPALAFNGLIRPDVRLASRARPLRAAESYEQWASAPEVSGVVLPTRGVTPSLGEKVPLPPGSTALSPVQELQASQRRKKNLFGRVKDAAIVSVVKKSEKLWQDVRRSGPAHS